MPNISAQLLTIVFCLLLVHSDSSAGKEAISVTVIVIGAEANKGHVIFSLFSSADNFLKAPLVNKTIHVNKKGEVVLHLQNLSAGTYAMSVIYDEDSNGKLNKNFLGIPTELVGFSNNAKGMFGPPSFKAAAIELSYSQEFQIILGKAKE
jgi:uncharacterized protein (DUF2141 family)